MYNVRKVVGDFFEGRVMNIFKLVRTEGRMAGDVPDLISMSGHFYVEVKASAYNNGGVINEGQLCRFDKFVNPRRFYAFAYHPISVRTRMQIEFPTEEELKASLSLKSVFLFPFSIVSSFFGNSQKKTTPRHDSFVQLQERRAQEIFEGGAAMWNFLGLDAKDYRFIRPHEKVHIVTKEGYLEKEILASFDSEKL